MSDFREVLNQLIFICPICCKLQDDLLTKLLSANPYGLSLNIFYLTYQVLPGSMNYLAYNYSVYKSAFPWIDLDQDHSVHS